MEASAQKVRYENLRSLGFATIAGSASYHGVGTPFSNPVRILKILNLTDANLIISFNGIDDKDAVAASSGHVLDYCTNQTEQSGILEQSALERVYVRYEAALPTSGNVYVTVIYASTT